jgi:hypothetical protein
LDGLVFGGFAFRAGISPLGILAFRILAFGDFAFGDFCARGLTIEDYWSKHRL